MNRNQIIAITTCAALCVGVYIFAPVKKAKKEATPTAESMQADQKPETLDIDQYISDVTAKITNDSIRKVVEDFQKSKNYEALIGAFSHLDKPIAVAQYAMLKAQATGVDSDWVNAGDYNSMLMQSAPDEKAKNFLSSNALTCYQKAVTMDSANTEYRIRLASAYMAEGSQPMQGIGILLDIVRKDSTNIEAQLLLSRFGLISGQYQKAIDRLEKILYLQPQNSEALLMMAEAYNNQGNKDKALELLQRCKESVKSPELRKEIDKYIQSIKKPS